MNLARASISKRLSLYLLGFGFIAFACSSFYAFNVSRQYAIDLIKQRVLDYVQALGRQIDSEIKTVETTVEGIATSVSIFHPDKKKCSKLLKANLRTNPKIYALGIGFAPNAYGTDDSYRVRHVWREGVMVKESIYGSDAYDYENRPWYILARDKMVGSWTGVYANKGDNTKSDEKEYVISYSSPIQENGNFAGAVMADLQTASLTDFARNSDNDTSGFVFIVERVEGKYILHKDSQIVSSGKSLSDLAQQTSDPQRFVVSRAIMDGLAGQSFMKSLDGQEEYLVCYAPLQEVNWTVGVIVPRGEILGGINQIALQILLIAVLAFGCFWLLIRRVCRSIVRPLEQLDVAAGEIAQGNLSVNPPALTHEDEVGRLCESVRQMAGGLAFLVREVQKITIHLATTTAQISASSSSQEEVVLGFEQEFSQAAAAVAEISASAKELARTMDEVQQTSMRAAGRAGQGKAGISTMEQTMHELRDSTSSMAGKLELVRQNAENIDGVVSAITDLAEQTNLLSLNASVEAEKAGEYGRGFTVVAREIRRLSDKTAVATLEISEIVGRMQESVESGVAELQLFSEAVSRSAERASGIGAQMTELIQDVTSLTPKVRAVNDGMQAQSTGAGEISQVMKRLKSAALQISEDMNHFKQSTGQLRASADSLKEKTSRFKT